MPSPIVDPAGAPLAGPSRQRLARGGCTQVVARTIVFSGNSQVGMDCTGSAVEDIRSSRLIALVE
jgi:hypothetical protein